MSGFWAEYRVWLLGVALWAVPTFYYLDEIKGFVVKLIG